MTDNPIDLVVTWVNGDDPVHQKKRNSCLKKKEKNITYCGALPGRFYDVGEIKYAIYSIRKFAPWIRNIFLITDNQIPSWLDKRKQESLNVKVIDHSVIFSDHSFALPTFNIMSIGSLYWKIPGLSDNFLSINDDVFFIDYASERDFFSENKAVFRGTWQLQVPGIFKMAKRLLKVVSNPKKHRGLFLTNLNNSHAIAARRVGFKKTFFETFHGPHTWMRDVQSKFYESNAELLNRNVNFKFRNKKQFEPSAIFAHLAIQKKRAIISNGNDAEMIIPRNGGLKDQRPKFDALKRGNHGKKFLCFQDLAFLKQENPEEFQEVIDWLEETIMK